MGELGGIAGAVKELRSQPASAEAERCLTARRGNCGLWASKLRLPNVRVQRTRSSPSALRSPLTRHPLGRAVGGFFWRRITRMSGMTLSSSRAKPEINAGPNMALQRTRRPRFRSGRSLRLLGSPLNARPLDGINRVRSERPP